MGRVLRFHRFLPSVRMNAPVTSGEENGPRGQTPLTQALAYRRVTWFLGHAISSPTSLSSCGRNRGFFNYPDWHSLIMVVQIFGSGTIQISRLLRNNAIWEDVDFRRHNVSSSSKSARSNPSRLYRQQRTTCCFTCDSRL